MIDLDSAKAARNEAQNIHPQITFGGKTFDLPVEMPLECAAFIGDLAEASKKKDGEKITAAFINICKSLLGKRYREFMDQSPSLQDMGAIVEGIAAEYAMNQGESSASTTS